MVKLEQLTTGALVSGLQAGGPVTIVATLWYGESVMEVTYKDDSGNLGNQLLYREHEAALEIQNKGLPWSFDADPAILRLVSEASRIRLAWLFDPFLAVRSSAIEPLPHQIAAVYQEMLPRLPLRYVLADDPGAGKTVMTGLLIKELQVRGDLARCLIVSPGSLAEQWQDELLRKFGLHFEILTNERLESAATGNALAEMPWVIARLDKLARNEALQEKLKATDWDLIVCDEAHKMSATLMGGEVKYTRRFQLGRLLSDHARHFLLLTATPHNGKEADFQLFLSLVDPDRFAGTSRNSCQAVDVSDIMRRLVKEDLLTFAGRPLFPERRAFTLGYELSPPEAALYEAVTEYVQKEFNRADQLQGEHKATVGFALTILQRRLASSPEAIWQSLRRRRERLEQRLHELELGQRAAAFQAGLDPDYDEDDFAADELETLEDQISDRASASATIAEMREEIATLRQLEASAQALRQSGRDRKWEELALLLQDNTAMFGESGQREKLIIFTEHKDTLRYLAGKIRSLLGSEDAVLTIHGGMPRDERRKAEERFRQDREARILIATDAAGEGVNLQRAHLMVNYDLPWNPNRLEQRFGRIHRIGQTEVCHLWNLVASETREGQVFQRLLDKLNQEREALGGRVFDILGKLDFASRPLRDLLLEAIRYGNDPAVRARLDQQVDSAFDPESLRALLAENALTNDVMDLARVTAIREEMERLEARKLQPHFIAAFFLEAFQRLGGKIARREKGRYEISFVPATLRNRVSYTGLGDAMLKSYERVCFDKADRDLPGRPQAALLCPGHPLLTATLELLLERYQDALRQGTIFVDENDFGETPRLLFYIEEAIQDGLALPGGTHRVISRRLHFVEIIEDGTARDAGHAPYLDYAAPGETALPAIRAWLETQSWLREDVERLARNYAASQLVPAHFAQVRANREALVDKTIQAVKDRLTAEIRYWDFRAGELKDLEAAGKANDRLNSQRASQRADELAQRLEKRMSQLAQERAVSATPPLVRGGALVLPLGLLRRLTGTKPDRTEAADAEARRVVEVAAMRAVMATEESLGYLPRDVSASKCGYDVESFIPAQLRTEATASLRFLEVKGRAAGADTVTVTKNEILTALNTPENFILALVEVDGSHTRTIYLKKPFRKAPEDSSCAVVYNLAELRAGAEILLEREDDGGEA